MTSKAIFKCVVGGPRAPFTPPSPPRARAAAACQALSRTAAIVAIAGTDISKCQLPRPPQSQVVLDAADVGGIGVIGKAEVITAMGSWFETIYRVQRYELEKRRMEERGVIAMRRRY